MNTVARVVVVIIGIAAIVIGAVFAGQGANVIPGSVMTGDKMWLYIGLIVVVVGIILVAVGVRRRKRPVR